MPSISSNDYSMHPSSSLAQIETAGGLINMDVTLPSGLIGNIVEDIDEVERLDGTTRFYKLFYKIGNPDNKVLADCKLFLGSPFIGDYTAHLIQGNQSDVWSDSENNRRFGCGTLNADISAGDQSISVLTRGADYQHFRIGDKIVILDAVQPLDATSHKEFNTINDCTWNGDIVALELENPVRHSYATERFLNGDSVQTRIASCADYGDVKGRVTALEHLSMAGSFDIHKASVNHVATTTQILTFTFITSNSFQVVSNRPNITLPNGQTNIVYEPLNQTYLLPYLTIPPEFWGGNWAAGDSLKLYTESCAVPFWMVIEVPKNATESELETFDIWISGYSSSQ